MPADFLTDLDFSNDAAFSAGLNGWYREHVPDVERIMTLDPDKAASPAQRERLLAVQRRGVDKVICMRGGKKIMVEEKIRRQYRPDICLEDYSQRDDGSIIPGWLDGDKLTDYLVYAFRDQDHPVAYFLPFLALRMAFRENRDEWRKYYALPRPAENNGYKTYCVAIPSNELFNAIKGASEWLI